MAEKLQIYKCSICGNIVEVAHAGRGQLVCCGKAMDLQKENTTDAAQEKHVPVVEKIDGGYKVTVGGVAHPMEGNHYIEWIELVSPEKVYTQFLKPGQAPEALFMVNDNGAFARAYCNLHGLWKS